MQQRRHFIKFPIAAAAVASLMALAPAVFSSAAHAQAPAPVTLLNVSYDPTRELYNQFNQAFAKHWKDTTGVVAQMAVAVEIGSGDERDELGSG